VPASKKSDPILSNSIQIRIFDKFNACKELGVIWKG